MKDIVRKFQARMQQRLGGKIRPWVKDLDGILEVYRTTGELPENIDEEWIDRQTDDVKYAMVLEESLVKEMAQ